MSDPNITTQRQIQALQDAQERLRKADVPPLYPPFVPERLIPFPLASTANPLGYFGQPWPVNVLAFYVTVYVIGTNDPTNFWTIALHSTAGAIAAVSTAAIAPNIAVRLTTTSISQPATTNTHFTVIPGASASPGAIYIMPSVALLRTGN